VLTFPGSSSLNISANLAKWHRSSTKFVEIIWVRINECLGSQYIYCSSSGDDVDRQPKQPNWPASSLSACIGVIGTEKHWSNELVDETGEPSSAHACLTHACMITKSQFCRQLSWARNKIWMVWFELRSPLSVGGLGPRPSNPTWIAPYLGYCRRRIGNRTQDFEWYQCQWPWVTSNPDFKVTILFNVKELENGTR